MIWNYVSDDEDDYDPYMEITHYNDVYSHDYQWYHIQFPEDWALGHLEGTGPGQCENCADYGCVNGVFIGYCANCALFVYNGSRGRGFMGNGVESNDDIALMYASAFDTYLAGVDVYAIQGIRAQSPHSVEEDMDAQMQEDMDAQMQEEIDAQMQEDMDAQMQEEIDAAIDAEMELVYANDYNDSSVLNCHFEGGYNDM